MNLTMNWPRSLFALCVVTVAAQVTILVVRPHASMASNLLISLAVFLVSLGCFRSAYKEPAETRKLWILVGSAFLISAFGQTLSTYQEWQSGSNIQTTALSSDFFFFVYGIPILLAISAGDKDPGLKLFGWLDGTQALVAAMLSYVQIFSVLPSLGTSTPISSMELMDMNNAENFLLVGAVTLRLFSNPSRTKQRFYQILAVYLWVYALVALTLGYFELAHDMPDGFQDAAWCIPYIVILGGMAFLRQQPEDGHLPKHEHRSISLLIDNLSPVLFTLAIVLMGVGVGHEHRWLGFTCITISVGIYAIRAALLQEKYFRSQQELTKTAFSLLNANDRLTKLSIRDGLTGIYNRRHFDEVLQREWDRAARTGEMLSMLMIDVDCFKALNDLYGHQEGDECLRRVALDVEAKLRRPGDFVARYGGEEFTVILPGSDLEGAMLLAEEIRLSVAALNLPNEDSTAHRVVTVSIGVSAGRPTESTSPEELLKLADAALYRAKLSGRNQTQSITGPVHHVLI
jgi:diguanylate cyclase (GGDEF)-like protein